ERCGDFGLERVATIADVAFARTQRQPAGLVLVDGLETVGGESLVVVRRFPAHLVEGQFPALLAEADAGERDAASDLRRGCVVAQRQVEGEAGRGRAAGGEVVERLGARLVQRTAAEQREQLRGVGLRI